MPIAWIIGGGSGIGAATARELNTKGWTVIVSGRRTDVLDRLCADVPGLLPLPLDVTDPDAVTEATRRIAADHSGLDLVIFGAAAWEPPSDREMDAAAFRRIIDTNLIGAAHLLEPVIAQMQAQGRGEIALIASVAGYFGLPGAAAYGASKAAMIYLAESLRPELAPHGIAVRLINPGFVRTDLTAKNKFPMPFLMDAEEAGRRIVAGLLRSRRFEIAFPRRMVWPMKAIRMLPYPVLLALMSRLRPERKSK